MMKVSNKQSVFSSFCEGTIQLWCLGLSVDMGCLIGTESNNESMKLQLPTKLPPFVDIHERNCIKKQLQFFYFFNFPKYMEVLFILTRLQNSLNETKETW